MRKFNGVVRTNRQGSDCHFEFFVEDGATEKEIEAVAFECAMEIVDFYYEEETDD